MRTNFTNMFRLFRIIWIDTSVDYNIKINSIKFFHMLCVNDFLFNNSINLFCNIDSNVIFNDKIFL